MFDISVRTTKCLQVVTLEEVCPLEGMEEASVPIWSLLYFHSQFVSLTLLMTHNTSLWSGSPGLVVKGGDL